MTGWTTTPDCGPERTDPNSRASGQVPRTRDVRGTPSPGATSPAQWARTLARGTVAGLLHLPRPAHEHGHAHGHPGEDARDGQLRGGAAAHERRTDPFRVQHLTDDRGGLLLLVEDASPLHERLLSLDGTGAGRGTAAVLDVLDVPPGQAALPRARLGVTGWVEGVPVAEQRRLAQRAAAARPLGSLLDVGSTRSLWRLEVADVRVTTDSGVHLVGDEAFTTATPDPLYEDEDHLVTHLEVAHRDALVGWVLGALPPEEARRVREVAVVGLDRYGLDVLCTVGSATTRLRAAFEEPLGDPSQLAGALCGAFGCPCGGRRG
ncbi:DUF2470 domain-containing protein [Kineococcus sp. SYSU DK004]|uniref:DUF2470 domain-containing protein n=1 Tax=Kineococcus sp. SYSU DK004 TaxID=3383125 RepID=UPI003D7CC3D0